MLTLAAATDLHESSTLPKWAALAGLSGMNGPWLYESSKQPTRYGGQLLEHATTSDSSARPGTQGLVTWSR